MVGGTRVAVTVAVFVGAVVGACVCVSVGGTGLGVVVGGIRVAVGGTGVAVGGTEVAVGVGGCGAAAGVAELHAVKIKSNDNKAIKSRTMFMCFIHSSPKIQDES